MDFNVPSTAQGHLGMRREGEEVWVDATKNIQKNVMVQAGRVTKYSTLQPTCMATIMMIEEVEQIWMEAILNT